MMPSEISRQTILVGEDESVVRGFLDMTLRSQGYNVEMAGDGNEVLARLREPLPVDAVLLDVMMPSRDGLETLREIRRLDSNLPVIMLSCLSTPVTVVEAMKVGASDFLAKPVTHEHLRLALKKVLEGGGTQPEQPCLPSHHDANGTFYGSHKEMREIQEAVRRISSSNCPIVIQGETGTGKEMLARDLHAQSPLAQKPFIKLNCASVPAELMESELFGYERGAFTGAYRRKPGIFDLADGGTLLLDEIGDMESRLQAKLLQVLQDQEYRRLGGSETVRVDVRVIAATHRDLEQAMLNNEFRQDLFYRLNVFSFHLPPLRQRREDLPGIAGFLLRKHAGTESSEALLTPSLLNAFAGYDWPGNIRELENVIRKLIVLRSPDAITDDLAKAKRCRTPAAPREASDDSISPADVLGHVARHKEERETEAILVALNSSRWNRKQAAALLKIDYKALLYKMKKLGIGC
jgi:two-component system response regulator AtoC